MKTRFTIIILTVLFQSGSSYGQICHFDNNSNEASNLCGLLHGNISYPDESADAILDKILSTIGASKRFVLSPCDDIDNAVATSFKGVRYILYDREFMDEIVNNSNAWSKMFILAHEVGHHINGHSLDLIIYATEVVDPPTLAEHRKMELESDEFAGFVLAKLGATLSQTQAALDLISKNEDDSNSTHPSRVKRLTACEKGYKNALNKNSDLYKSATSIISSDDYFYEAVNYEQQRNFEAAVEYYTKSIEIKPSAAALRNRGRLRVKLNDDYGGLGDYHNAIKSDSSDQRAYMWRARFYEIEGDHELAIADYKSCLKIDSLNYLALTYLGDIERRRGNFKDAFKYLSDALEVNPFFSLTYWYFAKVHVDEKEYASALQKLNTAIEKKSSEFEVIAYNLYQTRGSVKLQMGDLEGALVDFNKSLSLNKNAFTFAQRADVYARKRDYQQAINDLDSANQIEYSAKRVALKSVLLQSLNRDQEAIQELSTIINSPEIENKAWLYELRADSFKKTRNMQAALKDINTAIKIKPENVDYLLLRGEIKVSLGDNIGATSDFKKALLIDPNSARTNHYFGYYLMYNSKKRKDLKSAIIYFNKAIEINPNYADAYMQRGNLYQRLKDIESACLDWSKAGELGIEDAYEQIRYLCK